MKSNISNEKLSDIKITVGMFHEEMKSNSVTDFIVWIDCKMELEDKRRLDMKKLRRR